MRVAIFTTQFYPSFHGVARVISDNIENIKNMYDVYFEIYTQTKGGTLYNGFPVKRFEILGPRLYKISPMMVRILKNIDIIHIHHYGYWPAFAGMLNSILSSKPLVFTPHYHPSEFSLKKQIGRELYHVFQGYHLLNMSDAVLPITKYEEKLLIKIGMNKEKSIVIPNPVDTSFFSFSDKKTDNTILFVGVLEKHKGADVLFQLVKDMIINKELNRDIRCIFVGRGSLKSYLMQIAKNDGISKNFIFLENLSDSKLRRLYNISKLLVLPSKYEAFGMVLAEAMACGTPVVATRVGGIPEVVGDCGRLVDYGDWERMKKHIIDILEMPEDKYKKLSEKCRKRVVKNFDSHIVAKKLYKVYESLL